MQGHASIACIMSACLNCVHHVGMPQLRASSRHALPYSSDGVRISENTQPPYLLGVRPWKPSWGSGDSSNVPTSGYAARTSRCARCNASGAWPGCGSLRSSECELKSGESDLACPLVARKHCDWPIESTENSYSLSCVGFGNLIGFVL